MAIDMDMDMLMDILIDISLGAGAGVGAGEGLSTEESSGATKFPWKNPRRSLRSSDASDRDATVRLRKRKKYKLVFMVVAVVWNSKYGWIWVPPASSLTK
jgi:hypothetical protein